MLSYKYITELPIPNFVLKKTTVLTTRTAHKQLVFIVTDNGPIFGCGRTLLPFILRIFLYLKSSKVTGGPSSLSDNRNLTLAL